MNRIILAGLLMVAAIGVSAQPAAAATAPSESLPLRQTLHEGWQLKQARGYNSYAAEVPGTVHTDLMRAQVIDDPFIGLNERGVQWVDKEDWIYTTTFDANANILAKANQKIVFEGLDTYADVLLNGDTLLVADNMFRTWEADVKGRLKPGKNELKIYFHSPIKIALPMWEHTPWRNIIESGNDQSQQGGLFNARVGVFVRKAGYHFGWDWGPRLVTSGIWKPVYIEAWDEAKIDNIFFQTDVTAKKADVKVTVESELSTGEVIVRNLTDNKVVARKKIGTNRGNLLGNDVLNFAINNPHLWWCNGLGEPFLYEFEVELRDAKGRTIDRQRQKIGMRDIKVVTEKDQWGESFFVQLNGMPVFMKGANYIPQDSFLPRVTDADYERTIDDAVLSNMNMLRVWGGGIYEKDIFYDLCDEKGILVWQDFMFGCALYPAEGELMKNIAHEARQNVRRLRNHACMALWCGNNECLDMWFNWGVKRRYDRINPEWSAIQWKQYTDLYNKVLPEVVAAEHPGICYRSSSPYSNERGERLDNVGDYHDWDVWGQGLEFDLFNTKKSRFFSEYGFQGFPSLETIKGFSTGEKDLSPTSDVMLAHQRAGTNGNQKIQSMMLRDYGEPRDFESFVYLSQLMQADAMRIAMEAHRRQMPRCMGSLIWQMNDCWPVASWSGRDYWGNWKAQQYALRRAFDDILVSPVIEDGELKVYIVNDRSEEVRGFLNVTPLEEGMAFLDNPVEQVVPTRSSAVYYSGKVREGVVYSVEFHTDGDSYRTTFLPAKNNAMGFAKPSIDVSFEKTGEDEYRVSLKSDVFARGVSLAIEGASGRVIYSDNFFDMLPGRDYVVTVQASGVYEIENQLRVISYADAVVPTKR